MTDVKYRYRLTRDLLVGTGKVCWVMSNPSVATQTVDDLTIVKVKEFSRRLGARRIEVVNLWPMVATDPRELFEMVDLDGWQLRNRRTVTAAVESADHVVFAWGTFYYTNYGRLPRPTNVHGIALAAGHKPLCLGTTKAGQPRHPGRIGYDTPFEVFR